MQQALQLNSNKVQNLTAQAFGLALAKFSRQQNPSSALYEALKQAPKALELATQPTFFTQGKALSEVDIYDFLEYLINQGKITQSQSQLSSLMPRLRELRESIANPQSSVLRGDSGETQGIKELESSVESTPQNLNTKTTSKLSSQELKDLPIATQDEYKDFLQKIANKDYANTPEILKITTLNRDLQALINHNQSADVFITRARAGHISESRKGEYNQALSLKEQEQIPAVIHQAKEAYTGGGNGYVVPFNDTHNANKVNLIVLNSDEKGNFLITAKKINKSDFENPMYQKLARAGVEPATTTPPKAEQKPTEAISLARDEIIPQNLLKAQSEYFNPFMNEYEKIKEIKKLHTQDDVLVRVMKINDRYIEPLSNMGVSKEYLQKQTAQSLKENITQAILGNQTQLKALQQGYNTYHLSDFQKEVLESALDIANNPTKYKEYKLQGLQKQLDNLNSNEAYHIEKSREYDKARYAKDREELEKEIAALKGTESSLESAPQKVDSSDIVFTDTKGKEHTLTKEVQEQWLKTFNLKSLDESYTPKHSDEILQALGGKEIKLQLGSLKKLVAQGREQYIPQIKEVLDSPEAILKDSDNAFLFAKHLKDDDYFVNVSVDKGEYLVSISNGIKETSNIKNKVENGAEVVYQSPNANSNLQTLLQTSRYSANKIDSDIIPQTPQEIIKQAKEQGKSVAETKEYETLKEHIEIPLQKEIQQAEQELIEYEKRTGKLLDDDYKQSYIETTIRDFYRYYEIPQEVKAIQKKYFNQAMPQEYEKFLNPIKNLPEQTIANDLKELGSEANILQYFKDSIHNKYVGKSMAKGTQTAKEAEMLFLSLRYKDFDIPYRSL